MDSMKLARAFFTIAAMFCTTARAATVEFANTLGDGDIANPNNWPNSTLPGTTDLASFPKKITYYKASGDVSFGTFRFNPSASGSCKFNLTESDATVTISGNGASAGSLARVFYIEMRDSTMTLAGGNYNLTGAYGCFTAGHKASSKLIVTDNARITTAGYLTPGFSGSSGRIVVTNGASISAGQILFGYGNGANGSVLEIAKGGSVSVSGHTRSEGGSGVARGMLYVHGAGSSFTGASTMNVSIGYASNGAKLVLDDGASFTCGSLYIGDKLNSMISHANRLVASNSTIKTYQQFTVGVYGTNNTAEIYNTTVDANGAFYIGNGSSSSNNAVRLIGLATTLAYSNWYDPFFGSGSYNTLSFEDGASHTLVTGADVTLSKLAHHNTIRISGSGSSLVKTGMKLYMSVTNDNSYANSIIAEDGGTFQFYDMYVCRQDNRLVVSNGTMTTLRNDPASYSLRVGYVPSGSLAVTTNNAIVVQGDSPKVYFPHTGLWMGNGSRLHFDVPASGEYVDVPIRVVNLYLTDSCTLSADVEACLAGLNSGSSRRIVLAELQAGSNGSGQSVGGNLTIPQSVLNAANETLPKGCKFYTESKKLMLKVGKPGGMILVVQ